MYSKENLVKKIKKDKKEKKNSINLINRFWYSIAKPNKYKEMADQGVKKAIGYIFLIMAIVAICFTISTVVTLDKYIAEGTVTFAEEYQSTNTYLIGYFFTTYFISTILSNLIYLVMLVAVGWITSKVMKLALKIKEIIAIAIYSFTLPSIIYTIYAVINFFVAISSDIINILYIVIMYIYFFVALMLIKKEQNKK
jgi:hypothetical protein